MRLYHQTTPPPTEDWREIHATWKGGNHFVGENSKGIQIDIGAGIGMGPMELVLTGLAGCTGMDIVDILEKKRKKLDQLELTVRGMRRFEHPRIYTNILVHYDVWSSDVDTGSLEQAIHLSVEKFCSVGGMLGAVAEITPTYTIHSSGSAEEPVSVGDAAGIK